MVSVSFEANDVVLKFPKKLVSSDAVQAFLERLRLEAVAKNSQFTEDQAWELSEEIKKDWWQKNKDAFLKRS